MIWAVAIYWIGALADFYTTIRGVKLGLKEGNPLMRAVASKVGIWGWVALKLALFILFLVLSAPLWVYYLTGSLFLGAAIWNYRLIRYL